jgi:hypothetical protein
MSKYEMETIVNFNDEEATATIYTCNKAWMNRLSKFASLSPLITLTRTDEYSRTYKYPKSWVKIHLPKVISEEKRAEMAQRARERFAK